MKERLWAQVWQSVLAFGLLCFVGLSAAEPAGAQTELPSSREVPQGYWKNMIPKSYEGRVSDAFAVCLSNANISPLDALTRKKCSLLKYKLLTEECATVSVPDGVTLDILNGLRRGKPDVWYGMNKQTGRFDRAVLCDLEDGLYSYWFTGDPGKSCNNLSFVFNPQPTQSAKWVCRRVPIGIAIRSEPALQIDSLVTENCCCGYSDYVPSLNLGFEDTLQSSGYTEVCDWE